MFHSPVTINHSRKSKIFESSSIHTQNIQSLPKTPRKMPIFTDDRHNSTDKKITNNHNQGQREMANFCQSVIVKMNNKSQLVKNEWEQNKALRQQNRALIQQKQRVDRRLTVHGDIDELRKKNNEYKRQLLRAQSLLYQLKTDWKGSMEQLQELIKSLKF